MIKIYFPTCLGLCRRAFTSCKFAAYASPVLQKSNAWTNCSEVRTRFLWTGSAGNYGPKSVNKFKLKDKVPLNFELVYRNPMANYINYAQLTCIGIATALGSFLVFPHELGGGGFGPQSETEVMIAYAGLILFITAMQYVALKFPVRIYSDGPKFIAVKHGLLGMVKTNKVEFEAGSCIKSPPSVFSPWNDVRYRIADKELYILEHQFKTNADYNRMIGA